MAKKVFYTLTRDVREDGTYVFFTKKEGFDVPNELHLDLAVYNAKKNKEDQNNWYVVDCYCGLAVGDGTTKKMAIENALGRLGKLDMEKYRESVKKANEKWGVPPGKGIFWL